MFKKLFVAAIIAIASITSYAQKFGTVNLQDVFQAMPEYSILEKEMENKVNTYQTQAKQMQDEFQSKYQAYVERHDSLDELTLRVREDELQSLQQRLQAYQQTAQQQIQQYQQQQVSMIYDKMFKAVKAVGDRENYVAIFPTAEDHYFSATLTTDVTALVKTELGIK